MLRAPSKKSKALHNCTTPKLVMKPTAPLVGGHTVTIIHLGLSLANEGVVPMNHVIPKFWLNMVEPSQICPTLHTNG